MSEIKLKPCPFCKTPPYTLIEGANNTKIKGYIQCNNPDCGAKINFEYKTKNGFLTFDETIEVLNETMEAWNKRADNETD